MSEEYETLAKRQVELKQRLQAIKSDVGRGMEKDYEEQAIQLENMEVLEEIARVAEEELRQVELKMAALKESGS